MQMFYTCNLLPPSGCTASQKGWEGVGAIMIFVWHTSQLWTHFFPILNFSCFCYIPLPQDEMPCILVLAATSSDELPLLFSCTLTTGYYALICKVWKQRWNCHRTDWNIVWEVNERSEHTGYGSMTNPTTKSHSDQGW